MVIGQDTCSAVTRYEAPKGEGETDGVEFECLSWTPVKAKPLHAPHPIPNPPEVSGPLVHWQVFAATHSQVSLLSFDACSMANLAGRLGKRTAKGGQMGGRLGWIT